MIRFLCYFISLGWSDFMQKFGFQRIMAALTHATFFLTLMWVFFSFPQPVVKGSPLPQTAAAIPPKGGKTLSIIQELIHPKVADFSAKKPDETPSSHSAGNFPQEKIEPKPAAVDYSKQKLHYKDKVIVLVYHHIDPREGGITISPERFKNHLETLKRNDYNVISMDQFLAFKKKGGSVPQNAVLITFDDGYESFYTYAYPELKKYGYTATKFIVTDSIDHPPAVGAKRLTWDEMREMKKNGMSFYSHTYKHHDKAKVGKGDEVKPMLANPIYLEKEKRMETDAEYRSRIKNDLIIADSRIEEELGKQLNLLCFPFGSYNKEVLEIGRSVGIQLFFTTKDGINARSSDEVYRVNGGIAYISGEKLLARLTKYDDSK